MTRTRLRPWTLLALLAFGAPSALATPPDAPAGQEAARARAEASVQRLKDQRARLRVQWRKGRATPALVTGLATETGHRDARRAAETFLTAWPDLVQLPATDLAHAETVQTRDRGVVRFEQRWQGLPVHGRGVTVTVDAAGTVLSLAGDAQALAQVTPATLDAAAACDVARAAVGARLATPADALGCGTTRTIVAASGDYGVVSYQIQVTGAPALADWVVLVDGSTGAPFGLHDRLVR